MRQQVQKQTSPQRNVRSGPAACLNTRPFAPVQNPPATDQNAQLDLPARLDKWAKSFAFDFGRIGVVRPQSLYLQPKLTVGLPQDKYEQEADQIAAKVVNYRTPPAPQPATPEEPIQHQDMPEDEERRRQSASNAVPGATKLEDEGELQRKPQRRSLQQEEFSEEEAAHQGRPIGQRRSGEGGIAVTGALEASIQQARGKGQPLADTIREPMERAFGADFRGVKVHADAQSDQLNQSLHARAFTMGHDIFFQRGAYNPGSRGGQELLAHELTHVVQQNSAAVQREAAEHVESRQQKADQTQEREQERAPRVPESRLPKQPRLAQTNPYVIQRVKQHHNAPLPYGPKGYYDYRGTPVTEDQGSKGVPKQLATEVEAIVPQKPSYGGVPQVDPAGWYWLAHHIPAKTVAHTTTSKTSFLQRPGWVRFHLLNALLGGSGKKEENLVPARQSDNASSQWSNFETNAKDQSQLSPIHFYVEVDYHTASLSTATNPGNIHLGFFPKKIDADYSTWNGINWAIADQANITLQPPGTTANLVQYELTTASQSELKALGIHDWLSGWIVYLRDVKKQLGVNAQTTKQELYNIIFQAISSSSTMANADQNKLKAYWPDVESALNKIGGLELHIVMGNRGGIGSVALGESMINLFKYASKKNSPKERNDSIYSMFPNSNKLQKFCINLIIEKKLMGYDWDKNVSESNLYKELVKYSTIKEIPIFDQNWTTDLFTPMYNINNNKDYILPIDREPFLKITEQIEILKQELADKLNKDYYSHEFVNNTPEVQEIVDQCYNAILALTPDKHLYNTEKLEKEVQEMISELNKNIGIIYDRKEEEKKKYQEELLRQQQQPTFGGSFPPHPYSGFSPSPQHVPLSHPQTSGVQYPQPVYHGGIPSSSIQTPDLEQQIRTLVSQSSLEQLLQQLSPEQFSLIIPLLSPQQQLQLQQFVYQSQQHLSQQQQGVPQSVTTSPTPTFLNINPSQQQYSYQSSDYKQQLLPLSTPHFQHQQFPTQNPSTTFTEQQLYQVFSHEIASSIKKDASSMQFRVQYQDKYQQSFWELLNFDWHQKIYYMRKV